MKTPKVGQYSYCRRYSGYAVYIYDSVDENGGSSASLVQWCDTKEEARRIVWEKNGWGTPKKPLTH